MNWTKASAIAEITSSVAILATLLFLAIQTQQNSAAIQASVRDAGTTDLLLSQMENPSIWAESHNLSYTDDQKVYFNAWLVAFFSVRESDWLNYQSGTLDERSWTGSLNAIRQVMSTPMFRVWWGNFAADVYDDEFRQLVEGIIAEGPPRTDNNILRTFDQG